MDRFDDYCLRLPELGVARVRLHELRAVRELGCIKVRLPE